MNKWVVNIGPQELIIIVLGLFCLIAIPLGIVLIVIASNKIKKPPPHE
jgi:hypothetical protein